MALDSKTIFPFLQLSAELRNRIYELALVHPQTKYVPCRCPWSEIGIDSTEAPVCQPPLTRLCRQIRNESLPVYYGNNVFIVDVNDIHYRRGVQCTIETGWLRAIGPHNRRSLQNVYIHCHRGAELRAKEDFERRMEGCKVRLTHEDADSESRWRYSRMHLSEATLENATVEDAAAG